ncbi:MAG: DUF3489 domain-containing protein [Caulobacterales bacterium]
MTNITKNQREFLIRVAASPACAIDAPEDGKLAKALIKQRLAISVPVAGGASRLMVTDAGRSTVDEMECSRKPLQSGPAEAQGPTGAEDDSGSPQIEGAAPDAGDTKPEVVGTTRAAPKGKLGALVELLQRPDGATVEAMMAATGWQAHSVRGAMSGSLKKTFSFTILSEKQDGTRVYRIPATDA